MKKIFFSVLGVFLLGAGCAVTACNNEEKASITISSDYFIQTEDGNLVNVSLNEGDENFVTVLGKVNNATDGRINVSNNFENIVFTKVNYNATKDESIIKIIGLNEGNATLYFDSYTGGADTVRLDVYVYSDITGLEQVGNKSQKTSQFVEKNQELKLDPKSFLKFESREGGESNRKDVEWSFLVNQEGYTQEVEESKISLLNESSVEVATIENETLLVNDLYKEADITLVAESLYTEYLAEVKLVVLEKFDSSNIKSEYGRTSSSFSKLESIASNDNMEYSVSVVRNDDSVVESKFYVKLDIDCKYDFDVTPIVCLDKNLKNKTNSYLDVTRYSVQNKNNGGKVYIYEVSGKESDIKSTSVYLSFEVDLAEYEKQVVLDPVKVGISDVVSQMVVNLEDGQASSGDEFEIYDSYENGKGMLFNIQLKPDTVLEGLDTFKIRVTPSINASVTDVDTLSQYIFLNSDEKPIIFTKAEGDAFEAYLDNTNKIGFSDNSEVFVRAGEKLCTTDTNVVVRFISTQTEAVYAEFTLTGQKAPDENFAINDVTENLATNILRTVSFDVDIQGVETASGLYLDYDKDLPIEVSDLRYSNGVLSFDVSNTETGFSQEIEFTLKHKNKLECKNKIKLNAFIPLTDAKITLDNTNSFGISEYKYNEEGSLSSVVMTIGAVSSLKYSVDGQYEYSVTSGEEFLTGNVLTAGSKEITSQTVTITFTGLNEEGEVYSFDKSFDLEVYIPVSTVIPNDARDVYLNLLAEDSISYEDSALARKKILIKLRNDESVATYNSLDLFTVSSASDQKSFKLNEQNIEFSLENLNYTVENIEIKGNLLSFEILAKSTNGYSAARDTLNIYYNKFSSNIRSAITLNIENATRVQKVIWENEQDSIYINQNSSDIKERSFVIVTSVKPTNAYNANLSYIFVPDIGTNDSLVSISETGVVTINQSATVGGTGYIYILPSDSIKSVGGARRIIYLDKNNDYKPASVLLSTISENYNNIIENGYMLINASAQQKDYVSYSETFKKIRIIVADGLTEETAIRIYNEDQLSSINVNRHYELMSDMTLDSTWKSLNDLTGSIRGYVREADKNLDTTGSRSDIVITMVDADSFVDTIRPTGKVRDLTFVGNAYGAFVAKHVYRDGTGIKGTISNVTINVYVDKDQTIQSSKVLQTPIAGAIAIENAGLIEKVEVLGATVSSKSAGEDESYAGGIVGRNSGMIINSYVELYKFAEGVNKIQAVSNKGYAGGLVGFSDSGSVEKCFVYDYTISSENELNILGNNVGALIGKTETEKPTEPDAEVGTITTTIKNSFAVVNVKNIVASGYLANVENTYVSYYDNNTSCETNNSDNGFVNSSVKYNNSTKLKTEMKGQYENETKPDVYSSDYWTTGEGIVAYVNGGFEYLKFYQELKQDPTDRINTIKGKSLFISNGKGLLMRYETAVSKTALTQSELNILKRYNTISLKDLFGDGFDKLVVTSSNTNIVSATSTSISVNQTSKDGVTLTLYSNKDFSSKKEITIKVVNTIQDFASDTENSAISVQQGFTKSINYSISSKVYLGSEDYDLLQDAYTIKASKEKDSTGANIDNIGFVINGFNGTIQVNEVSESGPDYYILKADLTINNIGDDYNNEIQKAFTSSTRLEAFKGSRFIGISNEEITVYPSMVTNLYVDLQTDSSSDDINLAVKDKNGNPFDVKIDGDVYTFSYAGVSKIEIKKTNATITNPYNGNKKYTLTISVVDSYKSQILEDEVYRLYLTSTSKTATNENVYVNLTFKTQVINHIDMTNYLYRTMSTETVGDSSKVVYYRNNQISNILSPGKSAFMVIGVDPTFAYYDYFTVSAISNDGKALSISKLKKKAADSFDAYINDENSSITYEGYKLKVVPDNRDEQYIFRIYTPTSIKDNMIVPFEITFYDKYGNVLSYESTDLSVSYQKPAELAVNENKSSIIAKGGYADLKVTINQNQKLDSLSLMSVLDGISITNFAGPFDNGDKTVYYTAKINASISASVNNGTEGLGNFQVKAEVSRVLNGVLEIQETRVEMTLVDIAIVSTETSIESKVGVIDSFNLNYQFNPESYLEESDAATTLEEIRTEFKLKGFYNKAGTSFAINPKKGSDTEGIPVTERLYVVNGTSQTKVEFVDYGTYAVGDVGSFELTYNKNETDVNNIFTIRGKSTTSTSVRLRLDNYIYVDKALSSYNTVSNYYNISVKTYTDEDLPAVIRTADQFNKIRENKTAENYILMNDIELVNYTPFDTSMIESFDGNGYTINITSFDVSGTGVLERALFKTVTSNTTLKNIRVNYYLGGEMDIDISSTKGHNIVRIAGFAVSNSGIITNCHVMSSPYSSDSKIKINEEQGFIINLTKFGESVKLSSSSSEVVEIAGFVVSNSGNITNSTVGGESYISLRQNETTTTVYADTIKLSKFTIKGQGTISGFVSSNSNVITSSAVDNIEIINESGNINNYTSGFVYTNSGRISNSFIEGMYDSDTSAGSAYTKVLSGSIISSKGYVAGFVSINSGDISEAYSNILITGPVDETTSYYASGFVYINTGRISTSYSGAKVDYANISQTSFSGVDVKGESLNSGSTTLSYYNGARIPYTGNSDTESSISSGAIIARNPSSETQFYGFTFASSMGSNDGIWFIKDGILTLVAPNQKAFSHRVYQANNESYQLPYASVIVDNLVSEKDYYIYGGRYNPIVIRNAKEFSNAMGGADESTNIGKFCQNGIIDGSYRLIHDINLSELNSAEGIALVNSTKNSFAGVLDGNGFEINSISIGAKSEDYSVGLFSQLYQASIINLKLEFLSVTATTSGLVGGLAGLVYDSNLINITAEQSLPSQGSSTREFGIQGANAVGGIAGAVLGNTKIVNVSIVDPIVQATYYDENHIIDDNFYTGTENVASRKSEKPHEIRNQFEIVTNDNLKMISLLGLHALCKEDKYFSSVSYAGGLFGYIDVYTANEATETVYTGKALSNKDYNIYRLRVTSTVNVRAEISGGLVGYVGINTRIKDAALILSQASVTSNILSYNAVAGGLVGINAGTLFEVFAEHNENIQSSVESNYSNYYRGGNGVSRGLMDIFENTLSWDESVSYEYIPRYIGGLIGYARAGKLLSSYSKLNVISTVEDCVAGGIIGKVGIAEPGEIFAEERISEKYSATFMMVEVYSSGDVLGGPSKVSEKVHVTGGIIGETDGSARVILSSVNAVNYFGVQNSDYYTENRLLNSDTSKLELSEIGVYALIGKLNNATITVLKPLTAASISDKHIGYISEITCSAFGDKILNVLPYAGYIAEDTDEYFVINSLRNISSMQVGRTEMNGAFLGSGNWSNENWEHPLDQVFPTIRLINVADYVYWDQDNTEYILQLMRSGTTKEIRVRGYDKANNAIYSLTLDLREESISKYFPLVGFSGRLVGGWDKAGNRDRSQVEYQKIIFTSSSTNFFKSIGAGVTFDTLYIKLNEVSSFNGAVFIQNPVNDASFTNVTFDFSNSNGSNKGGIQINANTDGFAGIITPQVSSTNFIGTRFIFGDRHVEFNGRTSEQPDVYTGLIAGQIKQTDKYKSMEVRGTSITYNFSSTSLIETNNIKENSNVYVGAIAGQVGYTNNTASLSVSGYAVEDSNNNNNTYNNPCMIKIGNIVKTTTNNDPKLNNVYLGLLFGDLKAHIVSLNTDKNTYGQLSIPQTENAYVGGLVGNLMADTTSVSAQSGENSYFVQTEILYNKISKDAFLGGMFGYINTNVLNIKASSYRFAIGGKKNDLGKGLDSNSTYNTIENAYIGGIAGKAEAKSNLKTTIEANSQDKFNEELSFMTGEFDSVLTKDAENKITSTSNFTSVIKTADLKTANIGGFFGYENAESLTINVANAFSKIDVGNSSAITSLNAGLYAGQKENGGTGYNIGNGSDINFNGIILSNKTITTANIGGIIGNNIGTINIAKAKVNLRLGSDKDAIDGTKTSIADNYTSKPISAEAANIGGYIGTSSTAIYITGGEISENTEIAVLATSTTNVGGAVGLTTGVLSLKDEFKNRGLFSALNNTANETNIGGVTGLIEVKSDSKDVNINIGSKEVSDSISAFVDANFFVSANQVNLGGIIGKIKSVANTGTNYINNTIFGGAFKSFETDVKNDKNEVISTYGVNLATHVFGGIVGKTDSGVTGTLAYNSSFGDDIATYKDTNRFDSYTFGGIIGDNQGLLVNDNNSLTTCNNDRIAETDTRGAIVGNKGSGSYSNNLFSHVVNLATDANGEDDKGTDVGYITVYSDGQGYGTSGTSETSGPLAGIIKLKVEKIEGLSEYAKQSGSKLNPVEIDTNKDNNADANTNGVSYFTFKNDINSEITTEIDVTGNEVSTGVKAKRAIIGNARLLSYKNSKAFISGPLSQNEIISGMKLNIEEEYDVTTSGEFGGLIDQMNGGTIYAVALSGKLSVGVSGQGSVNNLGAVTSMTNGLIDESNSSVDVIYRGSRGSNEKQFAVAGFACLWANNNNKLNSIDIRNSYSTGRVSTYIDAQVFAFTDGHSKGNKDKIRISNCYTISQIDQNDHTTTTAPSQTKENFGGYATLSNCWYDINATQVSPTTTEDKLKKTTANVALNYGNNNTSPITNNGFTQKVTGWVQSVDYNFGYATRNFGYLKQSSYVSADSTTTDSDGVETTAYTRLNWSDKVENGKIKKLVNGITKEYNVAFIVPNAGKLAQLDGTSGTKYVQMYDFDLLKTGFVTTGNDPKVNFPMIGSFSGGYDGQEHTIKGLTNPLFATISGTVKNLRLTDVNITPGNAGGGYGALAKILSGATINNVVASGFISKTWTTSNTEHNNKFMIGGIVGSATSSDESATSSAQILNCKNYVKIDFTGATAVNMGYADVGGIVGNADSTTISNCINYAPIQNNCTDWGSVGGIAGYIANSSEVDSCGNTNSVLAGYTLECSKDDGFFAGGIVGNAEAGNSNANNTVQNCYNTAMVKAGNKSSTVASYAGGIVGCAVAGTFDNLYNSGAIEALGKNLEQNQTKLTPMEEGTKVKVTFDDGVTINVYASGIIGNGYDNYTKITNSGSIFRNGIYSTEADEFDITWPDEEITHRSSFTSQGVYYCVELDNYEAHTSGYDDLGYPNALCVTAERTITDSKTYFTIGNIGIGQYLEFISDQKIISNTTINRDKYCENARDDYYKYNVSMFKELIGNTDNESDETQTLSINGITYMVATDKGTFNAAVSNNYREININVDLTSIFDNYAYLKNASYTFDPYNVAYNGGRTDIAVVNSSLSTPDEDGKATLTIGYTCESTSDVSGINFIYSIEATKPDVTSIIIVSRNNIFETESEGVYTYKLYVGDDTVIEGDNQELSKVSSRMMNNETYHVTISTEKSKEIYTATYKSSTKTLEFTTTGKLNLSEETIISYEYLKSDANISDTISYSKVEGNPDTKDKTKYKNHEDDSYTFEEADVIKEESNIVINLTRWVSYKQMQHKFDKKVKTAYVTISDHLGNYSVKEFRINYNKNTNKDEDGMVYFKIESTFNLHTTWNANYVTVHVVYDETEATFDDSYTENDVTYKKIGDPYIAEGSYGSYYRQDYVPTTLTEDYTFKKERDSVGIYTITDTYGKNEVIIDNSTNTKYVYTYTFSNEAPDKKLIVTFKTDKFKMNKLTSEDLKSYDCTYDPNTNLVDSIKTFIYNTNIDPNKVQDGSKFKFNITEKVLTLLDITDPDNQITSSSGVINVSGVDYNIIFISDETNGDYANLIKENDLIQAQKETSGDYEGYYYLIINNKKFYIEISSSESSVEYTYNGSSFTEPDGVLPTDWNIDITRDVAAYATSTNPYIPANGGNAAQNGEIKIGEETVNFTYEGEIFKLDGETGSQGIVEYNSNYYAYELHGNKVSGWNLTLYNLVKIEITTPESAYIPYSFSVDVTGLKGESKSKTYTTSAYVVSELQTEEEYYNENFVNQNNGVYEESITDYDFVNNIEVSISGRSNSVQLDKKSTQKGDISGYNIELESENKKLKLDRGVVDLTYNVTYSFMNYIHGQQTTSTGSGSDESFEGEITINGSEKTWTYSPSDRSLKIGEVSSSNGKITISGQTYFWEVDTEVKTLQIVETSVTDNTTFTPGDSYPVIITKDINLGLVTAPYSIKTNIIGNGHFVNYSTYGINTFISNISAKANIKDLSFSGVMISECGFHRIRMWKDDIKSIKNYKIIDQISNESKVVNIKLYGSVSCLYNFNKYSKGVCNYIVIHILNSKLKNSDLVESYLNISILGDNYNNTDEMNIIFVPDAENKAKFNNHGVIIGCDGYDAYGYDPNSLEGYSGYKGQSFDLSNVINYGIVKAGNGGNGGRGGDGEIGKDSTDASSKPTKAGSPGEGGAAGEAGTVKTNNTNIDNTNIVEPIAGSPGKAGYSGNTGHSGCWLHKFSYPSEQSITGGSKDGDSNGTWDSTADNWGKRYLSQNSNIFKDLYMEIKTKSWTAEFKGRWVDDTENETDDKNATKFLIGQQYTTDWSIRIESSVLIKVICDKRSSVLVGDKSFGHIKVECYFLQNAYKSDWGFDAILGKKPNDKN